MKHFKLTSESKVNAFGITLFRLELTIDCKWGKKGEKGGWIESEEKNLSGNAWVYGDAEVYGNARVYGDAWVYGNARVYGDAWVYGDAEVYGNAWVYGNARVFGDAWVYGNARVYGDAWVYGNARVFGDAWEKSPLQIQGTKHFVCECKKGYLIIGCKEFTFEYWKENFKSIGESNNYTEKEIIEYSLYIDLAISLSKL